MKNDVRQLIEITKDKLFLFRVQLVLSCFALGICSWNIVSLVKKTLLTDYDFEVYPWAFIFFHAIESTLINYIVLCIILGLYGLFIYIFINKKNKELIQNLVREKKSYSYLILLGSAIFSILIPFLPVTQRIVISFAVFLTPLFYLFDAGLLLQKKTFSALAWILLFVISLEPLLIFKGPAYLMNEYEDIYGVTYIKGEDVRNRDFLTYLSENKIDTVLKAFDFLKSEIGIVGNIFNELKNININPIQQFVVSMIESDEMYWEKTLDSMIKSNELHSKKFLSLQEKADASSGVIFDKLKTIDIEKVKKFNFYNQLEYSFQNMSRGQINHIGHILNPINEYVTGKPLNDIYMQYGLGNTFIMKWTMDLFGGTSIDSYFKCSIYYIIYFLIFLFMLYILFKDSVYIFGAFAFVAAAYFYHGYIALILAPGILPTIHFFDVILIALLLYFFKDYKISYLVMAVSLSLLAIVVNRQFGMFLAIAMISSVSLYVLENKTGKYKLLWLTSVFIIFSLMLSLYQLANIGMTGETFKYFISGLFSWPAHPIIIFSTLCYLVVSYFFIFLLKDSRHFLKYIYVFIFIYTQGLFVYYYWSGLSNHLPTVVPFAGLQFMLMLYIAQNVIYKERVQICKALYIVANLTSLLLILAIVSAMKGFYKEKLIFTKNFNTHKVYRWDFERAHLITTINPEPISESVFLINKYSRDDKGIYIISKYDNLLPFLAGRHSLMPYFDTVWHLLSENESRRVVNVINERKPDILFVDTNINMPKNDPWAIIYNDVTTMKERASRIGRYRELYNIFNAVKDDYELIEKGSLISVYKRIS